MKMTKTVHHRCLLLIWLVLAFSGRQAVCEEKPAPIPVFPPNGEAERKADPKPNALPTLGLALLDGFEGPESTLWAFDSADDEGDASYVGIEDGATQGKHALQISLRGKGLKGKIHLRRDVGLDLSHASALLLDITSPAEQLSFALALKNDPGDIWQEAQPVTLKKGLNRNVRISLEGNLWKNEQSRWEYNGPPSNLEKTKRLVFLLFPGEQESGSFLIDNLRVEGVADGNKRIGAGGVYYREWRPELLFSTPLPQATTRFTGIEQQLIFRASYRDIFDSSDITVGWRVTTPSGHVLDVRGFFNGLCRGKIPNPKEALALAPAPLWGPFFLPSDPLNKEVPAKSDLLPPNVAPLWTIRFTPQEVGRYTAQLYLRNQAGETRQPETSFVVAPENLTTAPIPIGRRGGNVRISKADPTQLELQDGSPFFVFGQNVAWSQNFTPYLEKIKAYGGNTCRVWLCPWGLNLERKTVPGSYDLREAERIDRLLAQAEATGVRIIFCFTFHGATADVWGDSPYAQINGGPCSRPEDFFISTQARRQFKRLLSYASARWGSSPALLSWELINELDLARFDTTEDVLAWAREMAAHLKQEDVHQHLVGISVTRPSALPELWQQANIDWINVHGYGKDVSDLLRKSLTPLRSFNKPTLLAEFGGGWNAQDDQPDKDGARLQAALWLSACSPSCGMALPWWWDTYIEPRNLYPVLQAAGKFISGDDRRGRFSEWVKKSYEGGVEISGCMDTQGARLYVHHPGWTEHPESRGDALLKTPLSLELSGILDGIYRVEIWDAREGKVELTKELTVADGIFKFEIPARARECGIKIDRKERSRPEIK